MLIKLLKYDLKWTLKTIYVFLGLGLFFGILGRLLNLCFDSLFFDIVSAIFIGAGLSLTISGIINVIIRSWVRFTMNLYKDESYLTNTLPIERNIHYLSKALHSIIGVVISTFVLVVNLFIMYYSEETLELLKSSLNILSDTLDISLFWFIFLVVAVVFMEILFIIECGYFGIIFGYSHNNKKGLYTFIYGFVAYMVCTLMTFILLAIFTLFNEGLYDIIFVGNTMIEFGLLKGIIVFALVIYTVYTIVLYLISNWKFKKGINID